MSLRALDHDALERLEVGVATEESRLPDRSVQDMIDVPARGHSCCSWHSPER